MATNDIQYEGERMRKIIKVEDTGTPEAAEAVGQSVPHLGNCGGNHIEQAAHRSAFSVVASSSREISFHPTSPKHLIYRNRPVLITIVFQDIACQILEASIRRVHTNRFFLHLDPRDRKAILREVWPEIFILHAAYWPVDVLRIHGLIRENARRNPGILNQLMPDRVAEIIHECRLLNLDVNEMLLLETIILTRRDTLTQLARPSLVHWLQHNVQIKLAAYMTSKGTAENGEFGDTLLKLPMLRSIHPNIILDFVLKKTEEEVLRRYWI